MQAMVKGHIRVSRRVKELAAIAMIGDGVVGFVAPRRHSLLWKVGPEGYQEAIRWFAERPGLVRFLAAAESGVGLWIALRQYEGKKE
ncbi:hypothetical protein BH20ACT11_BH20ACT11_05910 [soil metagenome]